MAHYKLYCVGASGNSYKVALYLNCAGLDWEPIGVDFAGGQLRDPGWRAASNEMGEVPVLEVDGRCLSQSGAILTWLAETTAKFAPAEDQRIEALRWLLFDNHKFTASYAQHRFIGVIMPEPPHPSLMAYFRGRVENAFYPPSETGFDIAGLFPAIDAWRQRLVALPGWLPPYELMNVGNSAMPVRTAESQAA